MLDNKVAFSFRLQRRLVRFFVLCQLIKSQYEAAYNTTQVFSFSLAEKHLHMHIMQLN